jgi:hypothetical protein
LGWIKYLVPGRRMCCGLVSFWFDGGETRIHERFLGIIRVIRSNEAFHAREPSSVNSNRKLLHSESFLFMRYLLMKP